jgi:signal transduction histidine kinase
MALLIGIALLAAQAVNFGLLLNERERASLAESDGPAITRFVATVQDYASADPTFRYAVLMDRSARGARFATVRTPEIPETARRPDIERRLRTALTEADVQVRDIRAASDDRPPPPRRPGAPVRRDLRLLRLAVQLPDGIWLQGAMPALRRDPYLTARLLGATGVLYLIVLGAAVWIALRLARPLRALTAAAETLGRGAPEPLDPSGPADVRRLVWAFNDMNRRVAGLLDEKDRMLGAIGHDLKTPLASMRIRAESLEPPEERARLVATIEEASSMLDDILLLARTGRAREASRPVDIGALAEAVADDYADLGRPVTTGAVERVVATVNDGLLRRALRNLIDNALAYAGSAEVIVAREGREVVLSVTDEGPGVPEADIGRLLEPFERGEASRNRETGGSGLGLAIVRAIVEGHGGRLVLANRPQGGLAASLRLPAG